MKRVYRTILKIGCLLAPFYMIFSPELYENSEKDTARTLRRYTFTGFALYLFLAVIIIYQGRI